MQTRLLNAITALLLAVGGVAAQDMSLTANLTPTKASYIKGGPIELLLTVTNRLPIAVSIASPYPFALRGGITITPVAAKGRGSLRRDGPTKIEQAFAPRRLAAGETCSYRVYLQRFMADLDVGAHSLAYSIDIPARTDDHRWISAKGEGALGIGVFAGTDAELNETLAAYAGQLAVADLAKSDVWLTRAAEEALAVTPSPLVIPYLKTLFEIGSTCNDVSPLSKFRGNEQAAVFASLPAGTPQYTAICRKTSRSSALVMPLLRAPRTWILNSCGRLSAAIMPRLSRLRLRRSRSGRFQISSQQYSVASCCIGQLKSSAAASERST